MQVGEFPGGLVVRTRCFHCCDLGSFPGLRTEILHQLIQVAAQKKKKKTNWYSLLVVSKHWNGPNPPSSQLWAEHSKIMKKLSWWIPCSNPAGLTRFWLWDYIPSSIKTMAKIKGLHPLTQKMSTKSYPSGILDQLVICLPHFTHLLYYKNSDIIFK